VNATAYYHQKAQRSKYGATPEVVDGIRFHSRREAARYRELLLLGLAGELRDLELQPRFPLLVNGVQLGSYVGDFAYVQKDGTRVVEDVKSPVTARLPLYRWKAKHVLAQYGVQIMEV
jgi:hypothetical protein